MKLKTTHVAHTSAIATALAYCPWFVRLKYVMGVDIPTTGRGDKIGSIIHRVLELVLIEISSYWRRPRKLLELALNILKKETKGELNRSEFLRASQRLEGIIDTFWREIMQREATPPDVVWAEITILDPDRNHEGRLDAILEWLGKRSIVIEWKTYVDDKTVSEYDRYELISNMILESYRLGYDDRLQPIIEGRLRGVVITPGGAYWPRVTDLVIKKIELARDWLVKIQVPGIPSNARRIPRELMLGAKARYLCPNCQLRDACGFYRDEKYAVPPILSTSNMQNTWSVVRARCWVERYEVLKHREVSRKWDFKVHELERTLDPQTLKRMLKEKYIGDFPYRLKRVERRELILIREGREPPPLYRGQTVKVIADEPHVSSLLAKFSLRGILMDRQTVDEGWQVRVRLWSNPIYARKLADYELILLRTEVDLTRRELTGVDYLHRIVAQEGKLNLYKLLGIEVPDYG